MVLTAILTACTYGADCGFNCWSDGCPEGAGYSFVLAGLFFCFLASFLLGCWLIYEGLKGELAQHLHLCCWCSSLCGKHQLCLNTCRPRRC